MTQAETAEVEVAIRIDGHKIGDGGRVFFECSADAAKPLHPGDEYGLFRIIPAGADRYGHNEATLSAAVFAMDHEAEELELKLGRVEFFNQDEYIARAVRGT